MSPTRPAPDRFWEKVIKTEGCWEWVGSRNPDGYGRFWVKSDEPGCRGREVGAHRYSYQSLVGQIADGLMLDHLCRNRACVNPAHLEPVTNAENVRRGLTPVISAAIASARTHCPHGHELSGENVLMDTSDRGYRYRRCRTCRQAQYAAYRERRRAARRRAA